METDGKTIVRSRYTGLRDIYLAKVKTNTADKYETETPVKMPRAVSGKVSDTYSADKLYSDDGPEANLSNYNGTSVELEVNSLANADRAFVYGQMLENGFLLKSAEDEPPEVALGFRARRLNGKYDFVWLYCGVFNQGNDENYATEAATKTPQTNTLKGSFYQRQKEDTIGGEKKHLYECRVDESNLAADETQAAEAIKNWFSKVQEYEQGEG